MYRVYTSAIGAEGPHSLNYTELTNERHANEAFEQACTPLLNIEVHLQQRVDCWNGPGFYWSTIRHWHRRDA